MKKKLAVILVSLATALTGVAPVQAAMPVPAVPQVQAHDAQQVGHRHWTRHRDWDGDRRWRYRDHYYGPRYYGHRRYYRGHSNAGAIIGGLAMGAIIGGALAQPRYYGGGNAHVRWCHARYRSYRAYDNTFQPYHGPRRQCRSPY